MRRKIAEDIGALKAGTEVEVIEIKGDAAKVKVYEKDGYRVYIVPAHLVPEEVSEPETQAKMGKRHRRDDKEPEMP